MKKSGQNTLKDTLEKTEFSLYALLHPPKKGKELREGLRKSREAARLWKKSHKQVSQQGKN